MSTIISFGGGVQTSAMIILLARKEITADAVIFADTGCEKPETYYYIENYIQPLCESIKMPFQIVRKTSEGNVPLSLYDYLWDCYDIPWVTQRSCSDHFKRRPIVQYVGKDAIHLIGFSSDEAHRAQRPIHRKDAAKSFPLIALGISNWDCRDIISDYGWPIPVKSSCYICPFQRPHEWNWLKQRHPNLFQKALDLEARFHERKPYLRNEIGLFGGKPLRPYSEGQQGLLFTLQENSCWDGQCGR